jgi:hypothetical protein
VVATVVEEVTLTVVPGASVVAVVVLLATTVRGSVESTTAPVTDGLVDDVE